MSTPLLIAILIAAYLLGRRHGIKAGIRRLVSEMLVAGAAQLFEEEEPITWAEAQREAAPYQ